MLKAITAGTARPASTPGPDAAGSAAAARSNEDDRFALARRTNNGQRPPPLNSMDLRDLTRRVESALDGPAPPGDATIDEVRRNSAKLPFDLMKRIALAAKARPIDIGVPVFNGRMRLLGAALSGRTTAEVEVYAQHLDQATLNLADPVHRDKRMQSMFLSMLITSIEQPPTERCQPLLGRLARIDRAAAADLVRQRVVEALAATRPG